MVRMRRKDRVQIETGDAERGEIGELFLDAAKIPAEIIVRRIVLHAAVRGKVRLLVPGIVDEDRTSRRAVLPDGVFETLPVGTEEAVRKDLIDDGVLKPRGRTERAVIDGQPVDFRAVGEMRLAAFRAEVPSVDAKAVPHAAGRRGRVKRRGIPASVPLHRDRERTARRIDQKLDQSARFAVETDRDRFAGFDRAERLFILRITRMIIPVHTSPLYA